MSVKKKKKDLPGAETVDGDEPVPQADERTLEEPPVPAPAPPSPGVARGGAADVPAGEAMVSSAAESASAAGAPAGAEERVRVLETRVGELEGQLAEAQEQLLRKHADFDNSRKRMARDKEESVRFANSALLADLIEVIDGFELAIASSEGSKDFGALHQGVVLIEKQLTDGLERKWGLRRMGSVGAPFDPAMHQAITMGEPVDGPDQVVLEEYQSGYLLHERVVRPAKVKVSASRRAASARAEGGGDRAVRAPEPAPPAGSGSSGADGGASAEEAGSASRGG
jgi:molecular chaperone GrpE